MRSAITRVDVHQFPTFTGTFLEYLCTNFLFITLTKIGSRIVIFVSFPTAVYTKFSI